MAQASHIEEWARCMPGPVKQVTQTKRINVRRLGKQRRYVGKEYEIRIGSRPTLLVQIGPMKYKTRRDKGRA